MFFSVGHVDNDNTNANNANNNNNNAVGGGGAGNNNSGSGNNRNNNGYKLLSAQGMETLQTFLREHGNECIKQFIKVSSV